MNRVYIIAIALAALARLAAGDELLHHYEADVLPYDPSTGWELFDTCDMGCTESLADGFFLLTFPPSGGSFANYTHFMGGTLPPPPEPPLWVEWRYASNNAAHGFISDDGSFVVGYGTARMVLNMHGDAIISQNGGTFVTGLPLNEFRTFRLESADAHNWCVWYDGKSFECGANGQSSGLASYLQIYGRGNSPTQTVNRWDYVRYGRVTTGESIIASDPPAGIVDATQYPNLDRFTVTFDQPNYVYIDDVAVDVQGNEATRHQGSQGAFAGSNPVVIATRRQDNGPPETVEIVLDRPLTVADGTVRFIFNTGAATPQTVEYTMVEFVPCCLPSGQCTDLIAGDCTAQGGTVPSDPCEGDVDGDGLDGGCGDGCPADPAKTTAGVCGCGVADTDSDADSVADCLDRCPGGPEVDSDSDGTLDCADLCPGADDSLDANGNQVPDCLEPSIIPTASAWGLVVLALLLAIVAKVCFPGVRGAAQLERMEPR